MRLWLFGCCGKVAGLACYDRSSFLLNKTSGGKEVPDVATCPSPAQFKDINKKTMLILATCSEMFKATHAVNLNKVREFSQNAAQLLVLAAQHILDYRADLASDLLMKVVEKSIHGNNKKGKDVLIQEALSLVMCVPSSEMEILQEISTKDEFDKYQKHQEDVTGAIEQMKLAAPWLANLVYGDAPECSNPSAKSFFHAMATLAKNMSPQCAFQQNLRVRIESKFSTELKNQLLKGLESCIPFLTSFMKGDAAATMKLAKRAKAIKRNASDSDHETTPFEDLVKLADLAVDYCNFTGMNDQVKLSDGSSVPTGVACASPRLFRVCHAANSLDTAIKTEGFAASEAHMQLMRINAEYLRGIRDSNLMKETKVPMLALLDRCENNVNDAVKAWMISKTKETSKMVADLKTSSSSEKLKTIRAALLKPVVAKEDLDLIESDEVIKLHENMKALRALDSTIATEMELLKSWTAKFSFLKSDKVNETEAAWSSTLSKDSAVLCAAGIALSDMTVLQGLHRKLDPGENRKDLVKRVSKGILKRKWHSLSKDIETKVDALCAA
jgi:hypothetical protein